MSQAPPGVPHGMVPPKAHPPSIGTGSGQQAIKAMDVDTEDGANTGGITAEQPGEGEDKKASSATADASDPAKAGTKSSPCKRKAGEMIKKFFHDQVETYERILEEARLEGVQSILIATEATTDLGGRKRQKP